MLAFALFVIFTAGNDENMRCRIYRDVWPQLSLLGYQCLSVGGVVFTVHPEA